MKKIFIVLVVMVVIFFTTISSEAQVVINEIMASNTSTILNPNSKNFVDWIELYNDSDNAIFISDWYLSDDKLKPTKWKIPFNTLLSPKRFKLFWFDKENTPEYKNFMLNVEGETIYLFNKEVVLVDSLCYPQQIPDVSYGRVLSSFNELVYFSTATPMGENSLSGCSSLVLSGEPVFSQKAGFFEKSFDLVLSGSSELEKIYYTLDGSKPDQLSKLYSTPIKISKNTVVSARTYSPDKVPGKVVTQSYFVNESFNLPVISLTTNPKYLWDRDMGIYVEGANYVPNEWESANYFQDWERPIHLEYFDVNNSTGFSMDAGVKIHGRSTRNNAQKTLAVFARGKYGRKTVPYKLFGENSPDKIKSFLLRSGGNDWGITMFLDGLIHTLVNGVIDIDAQLYQPAIVFLNGEYWGIHNIREKINADYIIGKYQNNSSEIDIIEANAHFTGKLEAVHGNMDEYNKLINFIEKNELSVKENYTTVKKWIDIDEFINYVITQAYICNIDWPNSNHKFWKFRNESGKWRWALYDTELSFKEKHELKFNVFEHIFNEDNEKYLTYEWSNHLVRKLFESEELEHEFIQRTSVYLSTVFEPNRVLSVFDSIKSILDSDMARHLNRWGGIKQKVIPHFETSSTLEEWEVNINFFKRFAESRPKELIKSMIEYFKLSDPVNLKLNVNIQEAGSVFLMGYKLSDGNFNGPVFPDVPIRIKAIPNEGYEFVKWKGIDAEQECTFSLAGSKKITAVFQKKE